jgi:hypothetical protein
MKTAQPEASPPSVPASAKPGGNLPPLTARPPQPERGERKAAIPAHDEAHNIDEPGYGHGV